MRGYIMNINSKHEIEIISRNFRKAIENACKDDKLNEYPFNKFPKDCCDNASILLGRYLLEKGYECNIIRGVYFENHYEEDRQYSINNYHVWLDVDGFYVDITADQFLRNPVFYKYKKYLTPCFVGLSNEFFEFFRIKDDDVYFEKYLSFFENDSRLEKYYDVICSYM